MSSKKMSPKNSSPLQEELSEIALFKAKTKLMDYICCGGDIP